MRGLLRITASRAPYLRAGLTFPLTGDIDIRDLDGKRLLELARDPVLTVLVGDDDGQFRPAPELVGEIDASDAQLMIDAVASEMPERPTFMGEPGKDDAELMRIRQMLHDNGFDSVDSLLADRASLAGKAADAGGGATDLDAIVGQLRAAGWDSADTLIAAHGELRKQLDDIGDVVKLKADAALVPALENERDAALARVGELTAEIARLKAAAPDKRKAGKPGGKSEAEQK